MSENTTPEVGIGNNKSQPNQERYYIKPHDGEFNVVKKELDGTFTKLESGTSVAGQLTGVTIYNDPGTQASKGKRGYDAYDALMVTLLDTDTGAYYNVKCDIKRTFAIGLANSLPEVNKGDWVKIIASPGSKSGVTLANLEVFDTTSGWKRVYSAYPKGKSDDEKVQISLDAIKSCNAYFKNNSDDKNEDSQSNG